MNNIFYNKLVRDQIPEIIEADGETCVIEILPDAQYLEMVDAKLNEELAEYQESKSLEELADLLEVMGAMVKARGWTWEQLERVQQDVKILNDISARYQELRAAPQMMDILITFDKIAPSCTISTEKKLDFILWALGAY